jgi:predicted phosphodiesterase
MKIAVTSDIHGNLAACRQVLLDIDKVGADTVVNLGDNIGYGPEPEAVIHSMRDRQIPGVLGNHELALLKRESLHRMNPAAQKSMRITQKLLSDDSRAFCESLPMSLNLHNALYVHACPPESATIYLMDVAPDRLARLFATFTEHICFFGHTHIQALHEKKGDSVASKKLAQGTIHLDPDNRYLINVGSVGQPRDGNNNAKYVIWDSTAGTLEVRYVPYDIKTTADKILRLGFPEYNAKRLW